MTQYFSFRSVTGALTILAALVATSCLFVGAEATNYHFEAFSDPRLVLSYADRHQQAYWFLILDMFGYYLLLLPILFFLNREYKSRSEWSNLISCCGAFYILSGAIGAAVLAAVWPELMSQHISASAGEDQSIETVFYAITLAITKGIWNILNATLAGCWWVGTSLLMRRKNRWVAFLTGLTGISCLIDGFGEIAGFPTVAAIGLNAYLALAVIWAATMGTVLITRSGVYNVTKTDFQPTA